MTRPFLWSLLFTLSCPPKDEKNAEFSPVYGLRRPCEVILHKS